MKPMDGYDYLATAAHYDVEPFRASLQTWADIYGPAAPAHDRQMIAPAGN
jgi:hypothetical protein